jgi:asparagine synthase (glutamine-hydrolysing)
LMEAYLKKTAKTSEIQFFSEEQEKNEITSDELHRHLVEIVWYLDEPIATPESLVIWKTAEQAAKNFDTLFLSLGCHELFTRPFSRPLSKNPVRSMLQGTKSWISHNIIPLVSHVSEPLALFLLKHFQSDRYPLDYLLKSALLDEKELKEAAPRLSGFFNRYVFLSKFRHVGHVKSIPSSFLYFDVKTRLSNSSLLVWDRLSAAHGLECEAPFLDHEIVEFLAEHPEIGRMTSKDPSWLLKNMLAHLNLPNNIPAQTEKKSDNLTNLLANSFKALRKGSLVETGLISKSWLDQQLKKLHTQPECARNLWSILMLEIWMQLFIIHPIGTKCPKMKLNELLMEK